MNVLCHALSIARPRARLTSTTGRSSLVPPPSLDLDVDARAGILVIIARDGLTPHTSTASSSSSAASRSTRSMTTTTTRMSSFSSRDDVETRRANERAMRAWRAETSESLTTHARERARASADAHARFVREARAEFIEGLRRRRDRRIAREATRARDADDDDDVDDDEDDDFIATIRRRRPREGTVRASSRTSPFSPTVLDVDSPTTSSRRTWKTTPSSSPSPRVSGAVSAREKRPPTRSSPFFARDVDDDDLLTAVAEMCRKADAIRVDLARMDGPSPPRARAENRARSPPSAVHRVRATRG